MILNTFRRAFMCISAYDSNLTYCSPYSPDLNPIELMWAWLKTYLRKAKARTRKKLEKAIKHGLLNPHCWKDVNV